MFSFSHQITGIVAVNSVLFPIIAFHHIKRSIENDQDPMFKLFISLLMYFQATVLNDYCHQLALFTFAFCYSFALEMHCRRNSTRYCC